MYVTSEYIFLKPIINEINDNLKNTILELKKIGDNYFRKMEFKHNIQIFDEMKKQNKK